MTSRIQSLIETIEQGEPVDLEKTAGLLVLDMVRRNEQFTEEVQTLFSVFGEPIE